MPKQTPSMSWLLEDPETPGQVLCGFELPLRDGQLFKKVFIVVGRRKPTGDDEYMLDGSVKLSGMIRMSDLRFVQKKEEG